MKQDKTNLKSKPSLYTKNCRVSDVGLSGFAECQMFGPNLCPYAMPFGYGFLCQHPQVDKLVEKSKEKGAAVLK